MPNYEACHRIHGERYRGCIYYDACFGKCFYWCDLDSDHICGECACLNGTPDCYGNRSRRYGHCWFYLGKIGGSHKTNCPHFIKWNGIDLAPEDWVEARVIELYSGDRHDPEARPVRKAAREEWKRLHGFE